MDTDKNAGGGDSAPIETQAIVEKKAFLLDLISATAGNFKLV